MEGKGEEVIDDDDGYLVYGWERGRERERQEKQGEQGHFTFHSEFSM